MGFRLLTLVLTLVFVERAIAGEISKHYTSTQCPRNCDCTEETTSGQLSIVCQGQGVHSELLYSQLDSLLSSNFTHVPLYSISIVNSPLRHVPRSVCRLTTLTSLRLDRNRLTALPDNCFTNLTSLVTLSAAENNITELQDGLFDGLRHLKTLNFFNNQISTIGLSVLNVSADLVSLRGVDLSWNCLTSLEPWPVIVGMNGNISSNLIVDLQNNEISRFTNDMGWDCHCGMPITYLKIFLQDNQIAHFTDILRGWNITDTELLCIAPYRIPPGAHFPHSTAGIGIVNNPFVCDCRDYKYYIYPEQYPHFGLFNDVRCSAPPNMDGKEINRITERIEEIVCEITERCPAGCCCVHRPANSTLHVHCAATNLSVLPTELPELPKSYTRYKLDFSSNPNLYLEARQYFAKASVIELRNCSLKIIDAALWKVLVNNNTVLLDENSLSSLSHSVTTKYYAGKTLIALARNPWKCSCDNRWLSTWLKSIRHTLLDADNILCDSPARLRGRNVLQISSKEFCIDPKIEAASEATKRAMALSLSSVGVVLILLFSVGVIVYRFRVKLYSRWKFHPFDRDECDGEDMQYDVFLCCSSSDHQPHGETILARLQQRGYRVCYHYNDFLPGLIVDNIAEAITGSKRTVCLLTENFVRSGFCMYEFEAALHHNVAMKGSRRLIVLMAMRDSLENLNVDEAASSSTASVRQYLRQYTYIDYSKDDDWMDKLLYALPLHGLDQQQDDELLPLLPKR